MSFDWTEFLTLAESLAARGDEASKRCAISRAYYSAFNKAYERAKTNCGQRPSNTPTHVWCWAQYTASPDRSSQRMGSMGQRLKHRRQAADYEAVIPKIDDELVRALAEAHQLHAALESLPMNLPCP